MPPAIFARRWDAQWRMHAAPTTAFDIPDLVDRLSRLVNNEQLRCENAARRPRALAMLDRL
jgi:hypothetical protein